MERKKDPIAGILEHALRSTISLSRTIPRNDLEKLQAAMTVVGFLLNSKNKVTGDHIDVYYLTEETIHGTRFAGILGADTHIVDRYGTPLHIGDTVMIRESGVEVEIPVLESFQKRWVGENGAAKKLDFIEAWLDCFLEDCEIADHSCLDTYWGSQLCQQNRDVPDEEPSCPQQ